jgi:hypothetical protein
MKVNNIFFHLIYTKKSQPQTTNQFHSVCWSVRCYVIKMKARGKQAAVRKRNKIISVESVKHNLIDKNVGVN